MLWGSMRMPGLQQTFLEGCTFSEASARACSRKRVLVQLHTEA